jgi:hypothetical protein
MGNKSPSKRKRNSRRSQKFSLNQVRFNPQKQKKLKNLLLGEVGKSRSKKSQKPRKRSYCRISKKR